jgi:hypothetical protein
VKIIETSIFTKKIKRLLSDEEYRLLQNELIIHHKRKCNKRQRRFEKDQVEITRKR